MIRKANARLKSITRPIDHIIVHCTATKADNDFHAQDINDWHRAKSWRGIGYHYVVDIDGQLEVGREISVAGAHCKAPNINATSIGIVYVGGLDSEGNPADTRTPAQKATLRTLITALKSIWPKAEVSGHRDWANKDCPCFDATSEYKDITGLPINLV